MQLLRFAELSQQMSVKLAELSVMLKLDQKNRFITYIKLGLDAAKLTLFVKPWI